MTSSFFDRWLAEGQRDSGVRCVALPLDDGRRVSDEFLRRYCRGRGGIWWENLLAPWASMQCDTPWHDLALLVKARPVLLFFQSSSHERVYRVADGGDVARLMDEMPAAIGDFYVTDDAVDFALCCNDHDYLIGMGAAVEWVEQLGGDRHP